MKKTLVWILVAANVSLAGTLAWRGIGPNTAEAQVAARPGLGKYVMIPGESTIGVSIIYVFDSANNRIGAIAPDSKDMLSGMPTIQLEEVFGAAERGQVPGPGNNRGSNTPNAGNNNANGNNNAGNANRPGAKPR